MTGRSVFPQELVTMLANFEGSSLLEIQTALTSAFSVATTQGEETILPLLLSYAEQVKKNNDPEALGNLAAILGADGHHGAALHMLKAACETDSTAPLPVRLTNLFNLAGSYEHMNQLPEALATYKRVFEVWREQSTVGASKTGLAYIKGQVANLELYETLWDNTRQAIFYIASQIGLNLLAQGNVDEASPYLRTALEYRLE